MISRLTVLACALALASTASAATLPPWARAIMPAAAGATTASAVVLVDDVALAIGTDGKMRSIKHYAALIRDRAGRDAAVLRSVYVPGSGAVKSLRAWIVNGGVVRDVDARGIIDASLVNNDVYNEVRIRGLSARDDVSAGEVFVAELESEEQLLFSQFEWTMQNQWPTRVLRRTLDLQPGWRATSVVFNGPAQEPQHDGSNLIWERRDVAALPDEPAMPAASDVIPRLAVSVFAPAQTTAPGQFDSWQGVAKWLDALSDGSGIPTAAVTAKARAVTQGISDEFDRAAAIGRFVQQVQYISIQTGVGRGGGYQPRPPALVLERNYGDCKDKAALMRAMLAAVGIRSYVVSLYSGDRNYVRAEWASPQQFNHAIIAIALHPSADRGASAIDHPVLGKLVIFDPTDEHTPFGELPLHEQGSLALIVHPGSTALVRLPLLPADHHATDRAIDGVLAANGTLSASVHEHYTGESAATARALRNGLDPQSYLEMLRRRVAASIPRALVTNITAPVDASRDQPLSFDVEAPGFAQQTGGLVLVPMPFDSGTLLQIPSAADRKTAVLLEPSVVSETVTLQLPAGLTLDDVQQPIRIESPFGRYTLEFIPTMGALRARRRLEIPLQRIDPAELPAAKLFFDQVRRADSDVVVLTRKP